MPSFLVDARTLLAVRDTLGRLHDQLLGMPITAQRYDGVLGGRALEGELQQFCGRWHWGLVQIGGQMADMMGRLSAASSAYQRIEDRITAAGSGTTVIGGGGGGGGGGRRQTGSGSGSGSGTTVIGRSRRRYVSPSAPRAAPRSRGIAPSIPPATSGPPAAARYSDDARSALGSAGP